MANTAATSPGTMADDATVGTKAWSNPDNAKVSDGIFTTATVNFTISHYLDATNFSFNIPANSTINGITVEIQKKANSGGTAAVQDKAVRIIKNSVIGTTDKSIGGNWPTSEAYSTYGGSSDLWGLSWVSGDINSVNFGIALSITGQADVGNAIASVDHIRITIYYTDVAKTIQGVQTITGISTITL